MAIAIRIPPAVLLLGVLAAAITLGYFVIRGLRDDHATGDYHFTWGVGVVVLFLLGLAPGFVGLGLYLTVERGYPLYWLVVALVGAVLVLLLVSAGVGTDIDASVVGTAGFRPG
jgi:hypothetical protein